MTAANLPAAWGGVKQAVSRLVAKTSEAVLPSPTIARIRALRDWNG